MTSSRNGSVTEGCREMFEDPVKLEQSKGHLSYAIRQMNANLPAL